MKSKIKYLFKITAGVTLIIFALMSILCNLESLADYFSIAGKAIGYATLIAILYEQVLWKYDPFVGVPKLKRAYNGYLYYCYEGIRGEKQVDINVRQTLLSICVKLESDEIASKTLTSEIITEFGENILIYTYITSPLSKYSMDNPIQMGTCRLIINKDELKGQYWTNRKTIGDLILEPCKD